MIFQNTRARQGEERDAAKELEVSVPRYVHVFKCKDKVVLGECTATLNN